MSLGFIATGPSSAIDRRGLHHLYTDRQMHFILRRERARADRHQNWFSLVVFRLDARSLRGSALLRLARIILDHARATDEVGYYRIDELAVVLPSTDSAGAWRFAQRVCESAEHKSLRPDVDVYSYPTNPPGDDNRDDIAPPGPPSIRRSNGNGNGNGHPNGNGNGKAAPQRAQLVPFLIQGMQAEIVPGEVPAQPLEMLFVKPLPKWKRAVDLFGASVLLVAFSPVLLAASLAVKLSSPGRVIFRQRRAGLGGKPFTIYKFRTMQDGADNLKDALRALSMQDGPAFKLERDPRVTWVGKFLRQTSLDELPQLFNVLKGEMSLVGPRPLPCSESNATDQWHRCRLDVTPGLTCIWQIKGRSRVTFDEWVRMDIDYIQGMRLWRDLWIMVQTVPAMILRRGK